MALNADDHNDLRNLFARLALNLDHGNAEAYAEDYTEDGSFEVLGIPEDAPHAGKHSGRKGLIRFVEMLYSGTQGHCRHWNHNFVFHNETDSSVEVTSYLQVLRVGEVPNAGVILTAVYYDRLVKQDGRWRMQERFVRADPQPGHTTPPTDVLVVRRDDQVKASASRT